MSGLTEVVVIRLRGGEAAAGVNAAATSCNCSIEVIDQFLSRFAHLRISHLQTISLMLLLPLKWPPSVRAVFVASASLSMSSPDEIFALDCMLGSEASPGASVYNSALLVALLPMMLVGVSVGVCYLIARYREEERGTNLSRNLCVSVVLVLFLLHLPARQTTHRRTCTLNQDFFTKHVALCNHDVKAKFIPI